MHKGAHNNLKRHFGSLQQVHRRRLPRDNAASMADEMKQFGEHIRGLRKSAGLSQAELGERANINDKYLGEVERGLGNPSLEVLQRLAKALDVDVATLVGDPVVQLSRPELRTELNRHADDLTDGQLRDLVRMLRLRSR